LSGTKIAYFSMEVGLGDEMPTYSGGLGVLAGDTLRAAADRGAPLVAVTLLHRKGYFRQTLDSTGVQSEEADEWAVTEHLVPMKEVVKVSISGQSVAIRAWRKQIVGVLGDEVPVYFLDCDLPDNDDSSRRLTDSLYGGDDRYRLAQEAVLGIGGVRMLDALGYTEVTTYHMNEGHAALLTLELIERSARAGGRDEPESEDIETVRDHCVFTTHTPVAAGHDRFPVDTALEVLGATAWGRLRQLYSMDDLNMTKLALRHSRYVNGVARRHGEVTRDMFEGYDIEAITNGVHAATWAAASTQALFDRHIPSWRTDNQSLRYLALVPLEEIRGAHLKAKRALVEEIRQRADVSFDVDRFTIGFARRATAYKRGDLLLSDPERLKRLAKEVGPIQIVYAGKAHPHDSHGKDIIRNIVAAGSGLEDDDVRLVYLSNYGMELGGLLTAGCDLWLNTPEAPKEASGTSGMKAALNGVPSLSVLDGWWVEGHIEDVTGWSIEGGDDDAASLYEKLEAKILPLFYGNGDGYERVARFAMSLNGSFFNTERMVSEYSRNAYRLAR